jgi:hypothetical protein
MITADNASNNDTFMEELAVLLRQGGIAFHNDKNRIRYVIQICRSLSI